MEQLYIGNLALASTLKTKEFTIDIEDLSKWRASWLERDFTDNIWKFKHNKPLLDFHVQFINGEFLTDRKYISLLNAIKKVTFLKRSGHLADLKGKATTRAQSQYNLAKTLILFAQYLVNHNHFEEDKGFGVLSKSVFDDIVKLYIKGGRDAVSGHLAMVDNAIKRLKKNGTLDSVLDSNGVFDTTTFSLVTGLNPHITNKLSDISKDFLKQHVIFKDHIRSVCGFKTEFNNATPLKKTRQENSQGKEDDYFIPSKISDTALGRLITAANTLSDYQIALKTSELAHFKAFTATSKKYANSYYQSRRTPNIPTNIALAYIDSAVGFVHEHGKNIVSTLEMCRKQIDYEVETRKKPRKDHVMKNIQIPRNSTTIKYDVNRYNIIPTNSSQQEKRNTVSLEILIETFQTAVFILLATFACKRFQDVIPVKQVANTIGYTGINNIKFGLSKADPLEVLRTIGRPIPRVVADAFDNLVRINNLLLKEPNVPSNNLFQKELIIGRKLERFDNAEISRDVLIRRIIQYADFMEIPTVNVGGIESRWYLNRMHMLRRFFACAYYHTLDKQHLPALTWLMGHADTKQTMHYVTQNLTNAEMTSSDGANVIASIISDLDDNEDMVEKLSKLFGDNTMRIAIARNERLLEKRIQELINKGYRFIKKSSGELTILSSNSEEEVRDDA
ncbi:hypothetical protein ACRTC3_20965 [Photobacterium damselae]|uniref:hypothetical protein n=1 Tax=Photobacterium damselae TaxID=38293 RepID=UPI003D7EF287